MQKRLLGNTQFSSDPLLPAQLIRIYLTLCLTKTDDFVFWCALVLAFRGLLRKSSICQGHHNLHREDVKFLSWGLIISIRKSKTIQFAQRVHEVPISRVGGPLCAMTLLEEMFQRVPADPQLPLFGRIIRNVYKPLTYDWFSKKFKTFVAKAGLSGKFTSHSLRRGGATALSLVGVPLHQIQKTGDWKSMSVLLYLASPLDHRITQEIYVGKEMVTV